MLRGTFSTFQGALIYDEDVHKGVFKKSLKKEGKVSFKFSVFPLLGFAPEDTLSVN